MKIELKQGLLHASITLEFRGKSKRINDVIIDTGAAHTIVSSDSVDDLGIYWTPDDEIIDSIGIGGVQNSFVKKIDGIVFAGEECKNIPLDFGYFAPELEINGLIGLDILLLGRSYIDLENLTFTSRK